MGRGFPFFHYDILARIMPGALTLAVMICAGVVLPDRLLDMLKSEKGWNPVLTPIVFAGASYGIGVLYEVFFSLISEPLVRLAFAGACRQKHGVREPKDNAQQLRTYVEKLLQQVKEYEERSTRRGIDEASNALAKVIAANPFWAERKEISDRLKQLTARSQATRLSTRLEGIVIGLNAANSAAPVTEALSKELAECKRAWRFDLHNWVVQRGIGENASIYAHVHRFQAEGRMCLHSLIPACFFVYFGFAEGYLGVCSIQQCFSSVGAILSLLLLAFGAYERERRRWVQVFNAAEYLD